MATDEIRPAPDLGANLVEAPLRRLDFSVRGEVMGAEVADSWEPTVSAENRSAVLHGLAHCVHCGLAFSTLQLGSANDIHEDTEVENLVPEDALCHGYHHLGELGEGNARLAYLPGVDRTDLNHLQRLIAVDLYHGNEAQRSVATDLLNWLASHGAYVEDIFGTQDPAIAANVLTAVKPNFRANSVRVFEGMALVYNPRLFAPYTERWLSEATAEHPRNTWAAFYKDIRHLTP